MKTLYFSKEFISQWVLIRVKYDSQHKLLQKCLSVTILHIWISITNFQKNNCKILQNPEVVYGVDMFMGERWRRGPYREDGTNTFLNILPFSFPFLLQSILCRAAEVVLDTHKSNHVILLLKSLNWFPMYLGIRLPSYYSPAMKSSHFLKQANIFPTSVPLPSPLPLHSPEQNCPCLSRAGSFSSFPSQLLCHFHLKAFPSTQMLLTFSVLAHFPLHVTCHNLWLLIAWLCVLFYTTIQEAENFFSKRIDSK